MQLRVPVTGIASPEPYLTVSGSDDDAAHVFDLASGSEIATLSGAGAEVTDARFSPDGARIVTGSDDQIVRVWNAAGGEPLAVLSGHLGSIRSVLFSADGERIFSTAHDATGRIWTRAPQARMPDGLAGLWHPDLGDDPQAMPPELVREICLATPAVDPRGRTDRLVRRLAARPGPGAASNHQADDRRRRRHDLHLR